LISEIKVSIAILPATMNAVSKEGSFCSQKDALGMRSGAGAGGNAGRDVKTSTTHLMTYEKKVTIANVYPSIDSHGREVQNRTGLHTISIAESTSASKPDLREANRSNMRAKRSSDEAYRQRERLLNRERMRRVRAVRRQEMKKEQQMCAEPVQVVQAYAIPFEISQSCALPPIIPSAEIQITKHENGPPSINATTQATATVPGS
jgi:flagellar biosynthesis GTPase FlhF